MDGIEAWFLDLYHTTGINLTIVYDAFDRERFLWGLLNTVILSVICLVFSVIIGIIGAWLLGARHAIPRRIVQAYVQFFRNTPPLVQMYFFFFALGPMFMTTVERHVGQMVFVSETPLLTSFHWAVISLSFFAGAFNVEIFRSGIEAVPRSTIEAAEALGMSRWQIYRDVILPLAFRICLPALNNNLVNLVKTTTLAYAIAVPELLYMSNQIWSDSVNVPEMMTVLLFVYVGLVAILVFAMQRWERAMKLPGFGR
ncbi:MAG: amino acid ABC transporter permease [Rhodospirillaceae bacterium]|nr:amino acid ABC transporter permease [Rhodospirillaceae bacterium]